MIIRADKKEQLTPIQFYIDEELSVKDAVKIMGMNVTASLVSVEPMQGEAKVNYRVNYNVIYKGEDGYSSQEFSYTRSAIVKALSITAKSDLHLNVSVINNEYVGTTNVQTRTMLEICGYVIVNVHVDSVLPEGAVVKKSTTNVECIDVIRESEFATESERSIKGKVEKILCNNSQIVVKSVATATEICHISGECHTYLIYVTDGNIQSVTFTSPFETEILCPSIKDGDRVYLTGRVVANSVTLVSDDEDTILKFDTVISLKGYSVRVEEIEVVEDAYTPGKECEMAFEEVVVENNVCVTREDERVTGSFIIEEDMPRIRSLVCVCPPSIGAINVMMDGGLFVEGVISAEVIYICPEESINRVLVELPYRFNLTNDFTCTDNLSATAVVTSFNAKVRHNDEIEVVAEISFSVFGSTDRTVKFMTGYSEICDKEVSDIAISLYIARREETLWDVAKALDTEESTLIELNPELTLPLTGGERILFYRPLTE
ncbi:MAG: DUF3794 domain-containing protein [Clostridia bacterium]|nr:DUF3794 domain-containing protein [Clostridia bacterium]